MHNSLGLNYESPALTAELQARRALIREHPTSNVQYLRPRLFDFDFGPPICDCRFHATFRAVCSGLY